MDLPEEMPEHDMEMALLQSKTVAEALTNAYMRGYYDGYVTKEKECERSS